MTKFEAGSAYWTRSIVAHDHVIGAAMNTSQVPELPHGCGSWIVTAPDGRVFELYERANVRKAAAAGWRIETAVDYLVRINRMRVEAEQANLRG